MNQDLTSSEKLVVEPMVLQEACLYFDPDSHYAPVAAHEILRILFAFAANND